MIYLPDGLLRLEFIIAFFGLYATVLLIHSWRLRRIEKSIETILQATRANKGAIEKTSDFCHALHAKVDTYDLVIDELESQVKDVAEGINVLAAALAERQS